MIAKTPFDRRQVLQIGAGALSGLAITPQAIAQAPKGGPLKPFALASSSGTFAGIFIDLMKKQGYMEKYGLAPEFIAVSDGSKVLSAVISGEVDMVRAAGFGQVLTAIEKGGAVKIVGGAGLPIIQCLYTAKAEIKTLKDLEGRVVGTGQPGALLHHMTTALLRKNGVDVDKVKFVNVGSSADVFRAVVAGTVDVGPSQIEVPSELARHKLHSIADFWTALPEYPYNAAFASDKVIKDKRDTLVRALAAVQELYNYIQSPGSRDAVIKAYMDAGGGRGEESGKFQSEFLNKYKPYGIEVPAESVTYLQKLNVETDIQKTVMPIEKVADLTLYRDALKMIAGS